MFLKWEHFVTKYVACGLMGLQECQNVRWSAVKPLQRQLFQIAAVQGVQRHTGLTHHF